MSLVSSYLPHAELLQIFADVDLDSLDESKLQEIIDLGIGDMEGRLIKRFKVPLRGKGGRPLEDCPIFTRNKIKIAAKASIRSQLANEYLRNSDLNSLGDYSDRQEVILKTQIKDLLDYQNDFELELKPYAQDAVEPVQHVGIAKANNSLSYDYDY